MVDQARSVREFRGWLETVEYAGPYFEAIVRAVDRIYENPVLQKFWRKGTLVANHGRRHPYQSNIPPEYKDVDRWFLLDTSLTPRGTAVRRVRQRPAARQPDRDSRVCLGPGPRLGAEPRVAGIGQRPAQARVGVRITVPEYGEITVDVPQSGSFYHVSENGKQVRTVVRGGPASFRLESPSSWTWR